MQAGLPPSAVGSIGSSLESVVSDNVVVKTECDDDLSCLWWHWVPRDHHYSLLFGQDLLPPPSYGVAAL